jgi:hypothetical protein
MTDAEQYEIIMLQLLSERQRRTLTQDEEATFADRLDRYWQNMTNKEQAEMERRFSICDGWLK